MRRRALLATLAAGTAGLAGCSLADGDGSAPGVGRTTTGRTTTDDRTTTDETGPSPVLTASEPTTAETTARPTDEPPVPEEPARVVELETGPRTVALAPTRFETADGAVVALWFDRTATDEHPARLRGWLWNGNAFENTFRIDRIPAVGRTSSLRAADPERASRLHFAPTENNVLAESVPNVHRYAENVPDDDPFGDSYWTVTGVDTWTVERRRMAPGAHVDLEYHLVGDPGTASRATGTYEFGSVYEHGRHERTVRATLWDTTSPGPERESRFAGRSPPAFDGQWFIWRNDDSTVRWYHDADRTTEAFVRPSPERVELDGLVEVEMVNNSHEAVGTGHWDFLKLVDGRWFHVAPERHTADIRSIPPGGRKRWPLRAFNARAVRYGREDCGCSGLTWGHLGGGTYAVVTGYGPGPDTSAALVELVGDPVEVVPTNDAAAERDGDVVTVTTDRYGVEDDYSPDAALVLTRAEAADGRVIAEQIMVVDDPVPGAGRVSAPARGLRNALAFLAEDVARVVVRANERVVRRAVGDATTRRFRFRGQAYEASRGTPGE